MFVPRTVNVKKTATAATKRLNQDNPTSSLSIDNDTSSSSSTVDVVTTSSSDEIVELSRHQRWPLPSEPVCTVCGRYGEYIVDETDKDVCSIECKKHHLRQLPITMAATQRESTDQNNDDDRPKGVTTSITQEQALFLRSQLGIMVSSEDIPYPITEFNQLPALNSQLLVNLKEAGFIELTPTQMQVIPAIISGRDLMVSSTTGSGKSLSFLLPIIHRLTCATLTSENTTNALILSPTRELCSQLENDAKNLMKGISDMLTALLVGGVPLANQLHRLRARNIKMIIATPGRLKDILVNHGDVLQLIDTKIVVLDEVDSLLEMGFKEQINFILSKLPTVRQNLMFSATIPVQTEQLARSILCNPFHISVGKPGAPCDSIKHTILWVEEESKKKQLFALIEDEDLFHPPTIVFVNSRRGALLLAEALNKVVDVAAVAIHGEMDQHKRSQIFTGMIEGKYEVIVSTGLLARGVHVHSIKQVFVFDMPNTVEEFVHQVGRAGRLDSPGWAFSFINNESKGLFSQLAELFKDTTVSLPQQLLNSSHLTQQKARQTKKRHPTHSKSSLMDMIIKRRK